MMKIKIFVLLIWVSVPAYSQIKLLVGSAPKTAQIYSVTDLVFILKSRPPYNPFDIPFGAVFISPENQELNINGFYNDNKEFIIRFSPTSTGTWTYNTFSSLVELSGLSGTISVTSNSNPEVHGGVIIEQNSPHKFMYRDGSPYFALAFELDWLFALDYENKTDIPRTTQIINEVKSNGFNQVVMNVYAYDVGWKVAEEVPQEYSYKKPAYSPFKGTNENPDFSALNVNFFKHFDRVINYMHENGIVSHLMIYVWNKKVNWPSMHSADDNRYFDYVINRYQAYSNIIWDISKEALDYGRCDIPYINERINRIGKLDAYKRLITVHDYEYCSRESDRVDFISIQNWRSDLYSLSLEAYLKHNNKPVMNIEHGGYEEGPFFTFEGNYTNPETCLIRNYQCVFAGLYSTYYWQNTSWNIVVYDPMNPEKAYKKPRFDYYRHLQELFTRYDFNTLFPSRAKLTTNGRIETNNLSSSGYPLTNGNDLVLYLVPGENHQINIVLPEPPERQFIATWFNPFTGEYSEPVTQVWSVWAAFKSPWKNTYSVLILNLK